MGPTTIVGLTVELLRRHRTARRIVAAGALGLLVLPLARRPPAPQPSRALFAGEAEARARFSPTARDEGALLLDPAMVATRTGNLLAWSRWTREGGAIWALAVDATGTPTGRPQRVSPEETRARFPTLAAADAAVSIAWTADSRGEAWSPRPWFALLDEDARTTGAARPLSDRFSLLARTTWNGERASGPRSRGSRSPSAPTRARA